MPSLSETSNASVSFSTNPVIPPGSPQPPSFSGIPVYSRFSVRQDDSVLEHTAHRTMTSSSSQMYCIDPLICVSNAAYLQLAAEELTADILRVIRRMTTEKVEINEVKISSLQHAASSYSQPLCQQQLQQQQSGGLQVSHRINVVLDNNMSSSDSLDNSKEDIIRLECVVPFIQKIQSLLIKTPLQKQQSGSIIRVPQLPQSQELSKQMKESLVGNNNMANELEQRQSMMLMRLWGERGISEDGNTNTTQGQVTIDLHSKVANYIIDKTFDDHKQLLRTRLNDALEELEKYRSGVVVKELMLKNRELLEEIQQLRLAGVRRDNMMETLIIKHQEQLSKVEGISYTTDMNTINAIMVQLLRTFALCEAWQEEQCMIVFDGLWEHTKCCLFSVPSSAILRKKTPIITNNNNNGNNRKIIPASCRKSSPILPRIQGDDPHRKREGPSSIFKARLHCRRP